MPSISLSETVQKYILSITGSALPKTLIIRKTALQDFMDWKKATTPIHTITRTDVSEFCQFLINNQLKKPTIYNKLLYLKQFFAFAINAGHYPSKDNPASNQVSYTAKEKRARRKFGAEAFTDEEISKIIQNLDPKKPQQYWSFLIGLYTGGRVNEVAQLALKDFSVVESVNCITFTDAGLTQKLKNESSKRIIPMILAVILFQVQ